MMPLRLHTAVAAAASALLAAAPLAFAHDFWLVPNAFVIAPGAELDVRGQTSSAFPTSESAVALDRVADARLIGASGEERVTSLSHAGTSLVLRHRPAAAGQYVVATALRPRTVRESAAGFRRYMVLEGAPELATRYEREGRLPTGDSITRRYAKYAKTVVEVGRGGPRAFESAAGYPLEFVPLRDPAAARVGDSLAVRLLYRGRPLASAHLHAGAAPSERGATAAVGAAGIESAEPRDVSLVTDAEGVARLPLDRGGVWNIRTIHIVPAEAGSGADWDVHWATFVFPVVPGAGRSAGAAGGEFAAVAGQGNDSAAVVAAVERYHQALAAGDSAAALALLAPDAVILESGGVESRDEYRAHHLPGDIGFARAVKSVRGPVRAVVRGDVGWATSTSTTRGEYRGRAVNSAGAELMVLTRMPGGWKISAIHWSSRTRRP